VIQDDEGQSSEQSESDMTGEEVKKMTSEEIAAETKKLREKLFELRIQKTTEKVEDTSAIAKIRKDIARLNTEASARRISGQKVVQTSAPKAAPAAKAKASKPAKTSKAAKKA
jgi:large subunit ribosomal protein L29